MVDPLTNIKIFNDPTQVTPDSAKVEFIKTYGNDIELSLRLLAAAKIMFDSYKSVDPEFKDLTLETYVSSLEESAESEVALNNAIKAVKDTWTK